MSEVLFLADEYDNLEHKNDSTIHLARTAINEFGHRCFWAIPSDLFLESSKLCVRIRGELQADGSYHPVKLQKTLYDFHSVHWRKDPPVDLQTLQLWSLLQSMPGTGNFVNPPEALLKWNEKFSPLRFQDWAIPSFVADNEAAFERFFMENLGKKLVVKPVSDAASRGVQVLPKDWTAARKVLNDLQVSTAPWLMIQEYDDSINLLGETRAIFLAGKIRATFRKTPKPNVGGIMNMDAPEKDRPTLEICTLSNEQATRAETVASHLRESDVYLASIDFIGSRILEINVTSVGLLKWIDEQRLAKEKKLAQIYWENLS